MKKIITILFVIFLITGCKKEDPYKDLPRTEIVNMGVMNRYKTSDRDETYVVANITPNIEPIMTYLDGLFFSNTKWRICYVR